MKHFDTQNTAFATNADRDASNSRIAAKGSDVSIGLYELTGGDERVMNFQIDRARDPKQALTLMNEIIQLKKWTRVDHTILELEELARETVETSVQSVLKDEDRIAQMRKDARNPARCKLVISALNRLNKETGALADSLNSILRTAIYTATKAGHVPVSARVAR